MSCLFFHHQNSTHVVSSSRRVASQPETYLERLKREHEKRQEERRRLQEEQDRLQLQDATFEPQVTKCPSYITRIARGVALAKQAEEILNAREPEKPGWR